MTIYRVINRETKAIESEWNGDNVKDFCKPSDIEKMRKSESHDRMYFMINFRGLKYDMAMYEVDKYDLVIERIIPTRPKKRIKVKK